MGNWPPRDCEDCCDREADRIEQRWRGGRLYDFFGQLVLGTPYERGQAERSDRTRVTNDTLRFDTHLARLRSQTVRLLF